jgi:uncharacterized protein (DUF1015 family)
MAEIRPFKGVRYNTRKIADLAKVLCPPYDIISPRQQDDLYQSSDFNFIRIEYNKETPQVSPANNRYTRASGYLADWLKQGILQIDAAPALYRHDHYFTCQGKSYQRRNFYAAVRLEEWDKKIVRPHENIIPKAKSDRMSMLYACQCNTSEVLGMYQDPDRKIASLLSAQDKNKPVIDVTDAWGERHKLWAITQPEAIQGIQKEIASRPIYIADGHHRYDSALTCRREKSAQAKTNGEEGFNFVMMSLVDFADPGLVILPTHRLLRSVPAETVNKFKKDIKSYFEVREISLKEPDVWQQTDAYLSGISPDSQQLSLAVFGLDGENLTILTLRDFNLLGPVIPPGHDAVYRKLDVSIVDHLILEKMLGFVKDKEEGALVYSHDRLETIERVKSGEYQLSFILNPVKPEIIQAIADAGDRMPRKSTYFYPKSPAGLVFYKW